MEQLSKLERIQKILVNGEYDRDDTYPGFNDDEWQVFIDLSDIDNKVEVAEKMGVLSDSVSQFQDVWTSSGHTTKDWVEYYDNVDGEPIEEWAPTEQDFKYFVSKFPDHELVIVEIY